VRLTTFPRHALPREPVNKFSKHGRIVVVRRRLALGLCTLKEFYRQFFHGDLTDRLGDSSVLVPLRKQAPQLSLCSLPGCTIGFASGGSEFDGGTVSAPELGYEMFAVEVNTRSTRHGRSPCGLTHVGKRLIGVAGRGSNGVESRSSLYLFITRNGTGKGT